MMTVSEYLNYHKKFEELMSIYFNRVNELTDNYPEIEFQGLPLTRDELTSLELQLYSAKGYDNLLTFLQCEIGKFNKALEQAESVRINASMKHNELPIDALVDAYRHDGEVAEQEETDKLNTGFSLFAKFKKKAAECNN